MADLEKEKLFVVDELESISHELKGAVCLLDSLATASEHGTHIYTSSGINNVTLQMRENINLIEEINEQLFEERELTDQKNESNKAFDSYPIVVTITDNKSLTCNKSTVKKGDRVLCVPQRENSGFGDDVFIFKSKKNDEVSIRRIQHLISEQTRVISSDVTEEKMTKEEILESFIVLGRFVEKL